MNRQPTIFDQPHEVVSSQLVTHEYTDAKGVVHTVSYVAEIVRVKAK
jgi:hypothetical protein